MKFKNRSRILVILFCLLGITILGIADTYTVKRGDFLSKILYKKKLTPVYGKFGTLQKVVGINSQLKASNGNIIYPGMRLNLKISDVAPPIVVTADQISAPTKQSEPLEISKRTLASDNFLSRSDISLYGISEFVRIKASDSASGASATLLSDAGTGYRFSWGQNWTENLRSSLSYQSVTIAIQDSSSTTKSLTNKVNTLTSYEIGLDYKYTPNLKFINSLSYSESLVSRSANSSTIAIEKFLTPSLSAGIEYRIHQIDTLSLRAFATLRAVFPSKQENYDSKFGLGKKIGIGLNDSLGTFKIDGELYFQNTDLKMEGAGYDQSSLGIMIGIKKKFGLFE
tara:strand:+ start:17211 stop:18230 length:1020 start_codon:yes stop_codon:yes gene_type:complete